MPCTLQETVPQLQVPVASSRERFRPCFSGLVDICRQRSSLGSGRLELKHVFNHVFQEKQRLFSRPTQSSLYPIGGGRADSRPLATEKWVLVRQLQRFMQPLAEAPAMAPCYGALLSIEFGNGGHVERGQAIEWGETKQTNANTFGWVHAYIDRLSKSPVAIVKQIVKSEPQKADLFTILHWHHPPLPFRARDRGADGHHAALHWPLFHGLSASTHEQAESGEFSRRCVEPPGPTGAPKPGAGWRSRPGFGGSGSWRW